MLGSLPRHVTHSVVVTRRRQRDDHASYQRQPAGHVLLGVCLCVSLLSTSRENYWSHLREIVFTLDKEKLNKFCKFSASGSLSVGIFEGFFNIARPGIFHNLALSQLRLLKLENYRQTHRQMRPNTLPRRIRGIVPTRPRESRLIIRYIGLFTYLLTTVS